MIQLGFVSAIVPELPLASVMNWAAELAYDCVEVMCWPPGKADRRYAGVTHLDVTCDHSRLQAQLAQAMESTGITVSGLGYYPNCLAADEAESRQCVVHLEKVIRAAGQLGISLVNTFIGRNPGLSLDANWSRMLLTWRPLLQLAEDCGVRIGIENCPMLFTRDEWPGGKNLAVSPAIWRRLFADLPNANLGLNYDPSHLVWQQMDYLQPLREFADKIFHVHLKDALVDRQQLNAVGILAHPLEYHSPRLPGRGQIDWREFMESLQASGFQGPACVEVEDREFEASLDGRREALRQAREHLQSVGVDDSPDPRCPDNN